MNRQQRRRVLFERHPRRLEAVHLGHEVIGHLTTAGVDVELRKDMWQSVRALSNSGVTIILTTHYIEEAEEMADRIGIINKGELILVEEKMTLLAKLGAKQLVLHLTAPLDGIPTSLDGLGLELGPDKRQLVFTYDTRGERTGITNLLTRLAAACVRFTDLETRQSPPEGIVV